MPLNIDIEHIQNPREESFSISLLRLFQKADPQNYHKLKTAFPNAAAVFEAWFYCREIPDLPYD